MTSDAPTAQDVRQIEQLPQVLREIAELAPECVKYRPERSAGLFVVTGFGYANFLGTDWQQTGEVVFPVQHLAILQAALQALCEARGWWAYIELRDNSKGERMSSASVAPDPSERGPRYSFRADSSALALALAVRAALQAVNQ